MAFEQVLNDGGSIGALFIDLAPGAAEPAEIVQHQVNIAVDGIRDNRGRTTHTQTPQPTSNG